MAEHQLGSSLSARASTDEEALSLGRLADRMFAASRLSAFRRNEPGYLTRMDRAHPRDRLTRREAQVLEALARGLTNNEIAAELSITTGTVKDHLSAIYRKLGVATRTQAYVHYRLSTSKD